MVQGMQFAPKIEGFVPVQPGIINVDAKSVHTMANINLLFIVLGREYFPKAQRRFFPWREMNRSIDRS